MDFYLTFYKLDSTIIINPNFSIQEAQYKAKQELEFKKKAGTSSNTTLRLPDRERVEALPR